MERFSLKLPKAIFSGSEALDNLIQIIAAGRISKIALFIDKGVEGAGLHKAITSILEIQGVAYTILDDIPQEPEYSAVQDIFRAFKEESFDAIIALGGGSVMDTAKLISIMDDGVTVKALLADPSIGCKKITTIMIPTTAGTGSEATPNAIVAVPEDEVKVGIVNDDMIADYVILDPNMIKRIPRKIASSTGLDALAHAIECFTSKKANPFSDTFALKALEMIIGNIEPACDDNEAMTAKMMMQIAAFYAGIAITSSGTTAVHALSYPLGGRFHIPHGIANAMLLAPVMRFNMPYCKDRLSIIYDNCISRTDEAISEDEKAEIVIERLESIVRHLDIPDSLKNFGVNPDDIDSLAESALTVQRLLVNNSRPVSKSDAIQLYLQIMKD